jgi:hypothetical protein
VLLFGIHIPGYYFNTPSVNYATDQQVYNYEKFVFHVPLLTKIFFQIPLCEIILLLFFYLHSAIHKF